LHDDSELIGLSGWISQEAISDANLCIEIVCVDSAL